MADTTHVQHRSVADTLGLAQPAARMVTFSRGMLWAGLAIALAMGAMFWSRREQSQITQYVTQAVERGDLRVTVTATGNLEPTNEVVVGSELSGVLKTVEVDYDQRVRVGQVLARLDTTKLDAQASQTQAAIDAARAKVQQTLATLEESRTQMARTEQLAIRELIPQSDLDATRAAFKRAEADRASAIAAVAQAEAALQATSTDLSKTIIRSPINGIVLTRAAEPGQTVAASFQAPVLFTLAEDLTKMELEVAVDEADVGQVKAGQQATFTVDAYPDRTFAARIDAVRFGSQQVEGVVTYATVLHVDNPDLLLRPGMTATADLVVQHVAGALLVPNAALRFVPPTTIQQTSSNDDGNLISRLMPRPARRESAVPDVQSGPGTQQRVWVLQNGQPVAVTIRVGATDGQMTEVLGGELQPGQGVIVDTATEPS